MASIAGGVAQAMTSRHAALPSEITTKQEGQHVGTATRGKLENLSPEELNHLQQSLFEHSKGESAIHGQKMAAAFATLSPKEQLEVARQLFENTYAMPTHEDTRSNTFSSENQIHQSNPNLSAKNVFRSNQAHDDKRTNAQKSAQSAKYISRNGAPMESLAGVVAKQIQMQQQQFVSDSMSGDLQGMFGPNPSFEDVVMYIMMKIAQKEERNLKERIKVMERSHSGSATALGANKLKTLGGIAGGALGSYLGGAEGALVGQDLGERITGGLTGDLGGNSSESRQLQFEKLKFDLQKLNELIALLSSVSKMQHDSAMRTIGNLRG